MSKTVVVISDSGRLIDVQGTLRENHVHYAKFAKRLLGKSGTSATLDYGWDGANNLVVSKAGNPGQSITLKASSVVVSGNLVVGGRSLQAIIDESTDLAISGISGKSGEIDVSITENSDSGEGVPRLSCLVSLSSSFLQRISVIEKTLADIFQFPNYYVPGDGLHVEYGTVKTIGVKLGSGLVFTETYGSSDSSSPESTRAVSVDVVNLPIRGSMKPITSGAVYEALQGGVVTGPYSVRLDPTTRNMTLYYSVDSGSSDPT